MVYLVVTLGETWGGVLRFLRSQRAHFLKLPLHKGSKELEPSLQLSYGELKTPNPSMHRSCLK